MPAEEKVLCFERKLLDDIGAFQGFNPAVEKYLPAITSSSKLVYLNRSTVEQDKRYKQLIPYCLLLCNGKILRYRRGKDGQETRLHGLYSVGIGGHISEEDNGPLSSHNGYYEGMQRELMEEVGLRRELLKETETAIAVINDDSTDVGSVHFGVVHIVHVADEKIAENREGIFDPRFITMAEATKNLADYEGWSRLCLENFNFNAVY